MAMRWVPSPTLIMTLIEDIIKLRPKTREESYYQAE